MRFLLRGPTRSAVILLCLAATLLPAAAALAGPTEHPPAPPESLAHAAEAGIESAVDLGDGMMGARLDNGAWFVASHGSTMRTYQKDAVETDADGTKVKGVESGFEITPPDGHELQANGSVELKEPWEYALEAGFITAEQAAEAAEKFLEPTGENGAMESIAERQRRDGSTTASTEARGDVESQGELFAEGCGGSVPNATGSSYGCYKRYRGKNFHYSTTSFATGTQKGLWILTRVRTGTKYKASNPEIRDWRPKKRIDQSKCANVKLTYSNPSSGVGLDVGVKDVICANALDVKEINRSNFVAQWRGSAMSARAAIAIDVIYNKNDRPSGFTYVTSMFAT